jgi:glycosyltransferase involved in cell wall biosynthesis
MPLSLIEASSIGVPIIASNVGSVCEIVTDEENGLLVEAGNIDSFYSNTIRLLENPSLRQKMSESKHKSRTDFTFKQSASNHAAIYQKLFLENCA